MSNTSNPRLKPHNHPVSTKPRQLQFGAAMERDPGRQRLRAYELLTKKFDDFVYRVSSGGLQRGLIIHDRSGIEGYLKISLPPQQGAGDGDGNAKAA